MEDEEGEMGKELRKMMRRAERWDALERDGVGLDGWI
jgi:hypothetical protein